jgi:hypothetical protein
VCDIDRYYAVVDDLLSLDLYTVIEDKDSHPGSPVGAVPYGSPPCCMSLRIKADILQCRHIDPVTAEVFNYVLLFVTIPETINV